MAEGRQPYHSGNVAFYESLRQPVLARLRQELNGAPDTCTVCAQLCECAAEFDPEVRIRYRFGLTLDAIQALDCAAHRPFFEKFREAMDEKTRRFHRGAAAEDVRWQAEAAWPTRYPLGVELRNGVLHVGWGNLGRRVQMEMTRRDDVPGHPGGWARIRSPRVDLGLIKSWRQRCAALHGDDCANPWKVAPIKPRWLIDVEQRCLVPGEAADAYICLSYRRGKSPGFRTTRAALPDLQRPGCLDDPTIYERFPRVVSDALQLVRDLGERYLWVDALCVAADDAAAEAAEIARMGRLYGGAALTLVAADDDDGDDIGLPGVTDAAPARLTSQMLVPLGGERLLAFPTTGANPTHDTAYSGRAWTCQEYTLAGRRLVFAGRRVHWVCPRQTCDEWQRTERLCCDAQCPKHNPPSARGTRAPSLTVHGLPDLGAYGDLIRWYNDCALTDNADAPRAVAGLLAVLGRGFVGGFLSGLPAMFLDAALGWRPANRGWDEANVTRRTVAHPREGDPVTSLPSWSWLGWQGPVQCCYDEDGFMSWGSDTAYQTHAITTWHATASPFADRDGSPPVPSWFPNRPAHCAPAGPLPPGWRRLHLDTPGEAPSHGFDRPPAGCGRCVFAHDGLPYQYFWYHFALAAGPTEDEETPPWSPQPSYLRAATARLRLEAYRDPALAPGPGRSRPTVGLRDARGKRVGHLWLHSVDDFARFPEEEGGGVAVELVAVCRRASAQEPKPYEVDEFYQEHYAVLWVEWEEGVAYRQASGVVDRGAWDAHPGREDIDLILG